MMTKLRMILSLVALLCTVSPSLAAQHLTAQLIADTTAIQPGKPFTVGLLLHLDPGWHVYWTNPGDAGAPTTLKLTLPDGFTVGPVLYPVPTVMPQPQSMTIYAFDNEQMLMATVTPPASLKGRTSIPISAAAAWCACTSEVCTLGKQQVDLSLPVGNAAAANQGVFNSWRQRLPIPAAAVFGSISREVSGSAAAGGQTRALINFTWKTDPPAKDFTWIPGPSDDLTVKSAGIHTGGQVTTVALWVEPIQGIPATSSTITGLLAYQLPGKPPAGVAIKLDRQTMELVPDGR